MRPINYILKFYLNGAVGALGDHKSSSLSSAYLTKRFKIDNVFSFVAKSIYRHDTKSEILDSTSRDQKESRFYNIIPGQTEPDLS